SVQLTFLTRLSAPCAGGVTIRNVSFVLSTSVAVSVTRTARPPSASSSHCLSVSSSLSPHPLEFHPWPSLRLRSYSSWSRRSSSSLSLWYGRTMTSTFLSWVMG